MWALRAKEAHDPAQDTSKGLTKYYQLALGVGTFALIAGSMHLLRALLVNATLPGPLKATGDGEAAMMQGEDQPRARKRYRYIFTVLTVLSFAPLAVGIASGKLYPQSETNAKMAMTVQGLR